MLGITPLIDIVFLLLIFFMLTSHFHVASGVPIRLPKVTQNAHNGTDRKVIIAIDRNGLTYIQGEKIEPKELGPSLKTLVKGGLIEEKDIPEIYGRITFTLSMEEACADADLAIETVVEKQDVKEQIFKQFDELCPPRQSLQVTQLH